MNLTPDVITFMVHKLSKQEIMMLHKSIKHYTKKITGEIDLQKNIICLLSAYEILYNRLNKMVNDDANNISIDKSKVYNMNRNDLYGFHACFRKAMRYTCTKEGAINNIIAFSKQVNYFLTY